MPIPSILVAVLVRQNPVVAFFLVIGERGAGVTESFGSVASTIGSAVLPLNLLTFWLRGLSRCLLGNLPDGGFLLLSRLDLGNGTHDG
jgi:hypothetical protein